MARNVVDYELLAQGKASYSQKAKDLGDILKQLERMNSNMMEGWQNETATAFVKRFESDHKKKINSLIGELEKISSYLLKYAEEIRRIDHEGAGGVSGQR